jgi:sugar lactone lactonase YvrE
MSRGNRLFAHLVSSSQTIETGISAWRKTALRSVAALAALALAAAGAGAQGASFPNENVGSSSGGQAVPVTATRAGTVKTIEVLTLGQANLDFSADTLPADSGLTTCAAATLAIAQTCNVGVIFTPTAPGLRFGAAVLLDAGSNVLGAAYIYGAGIGALGAFVPGYVATYAGDGLYLGPLGDGGQALNGELYLPSGVALDGAGNLYIADSAHNRVRMVCAAPSSGIINGTQAECTAAGIIITVAGGGTVCSGQTDPIGDGCLASESTLASPGGVTVDGAGNLYIADTGNNEVRVVNAASGIITVFAGDVNGVCTGATDSLGDGCQATSATLNQPQGSTFGASGNIYIADTSDNLIRVVAPSGIITRLVGGGAGCTTQTDSVGDGCTASQAVLDNPYPVAFDASGDMYIPDSSHNRVREVAATGGVVTSSSPISNFAGTGAEAYSGDGGPATSAGLFAPSGLAIDPAGNVYIADTQNSAIREVNVNTLDIETIISSTTNLTYNPSAMPPFSEIKVYGPVGLALDSHGDLFVGDTLQMLVQEMQSNLSIVDLLPPPSTNAIRVDSVSNPQLITVDNIGNSPLDLTGITPQTNAQVDAGTTTCNAGTPYLGVGDTCIVGAVFAPTTAADPLIANIDVTSQTGNSPLDIEIVGDALALNSTTTTITSSPNPSNFGQNVTFTVSVTTGTGTLDGTVTITDTFQGAQTTLASNLQLTVADTATYSISTLPVGVHTIVAAYGNDTNGHSSSTSTDNGAQPLLQTVNEQTTTTLASSGSPSTQGQSVTFTATVAISGGGGVTPDGTVTFMNGTTALGTSSLGINGVATFATAALPLGVNPITAVYSGDATIEVLGSTSAVLNQDVQATSSIVLASSPNPSTFGAKVTFTATITSASSNAATGTVTFMNGATSIGTGKLSGNPAVATLATAALPVGTDPITAVYAGDNYNSAGTSNTVQQQVNPAASTTGIASTPNPSTYGQNVTFTVTVTASSGTGSLSGTATIADTFNGNTVNLATGLSLKSGQATFQINTLAIGLHSIVATYSGDTDHATSSSSPLMQTVQEGTTTALISNQNPTTQGQSVTFTATVTPGPGGVTPDGTVTFMNGTATLGTQTLTAGSASFSTTTLPIGVNPITAVYSGDSANGIQGSTSNVVQQDVQAASTITVAPSQNPSNYGSPVTFTATVTSAATVGATGTVNFLDNGVQIGAGTLSGNPATAQYQTSTLTVGAHPITVVYAGDSNYTAATSAPPLQQVVNPTPTTTTVSAKPNPGIAGEPETITATVSSTAPVSQLTGIVTFTSGTTTLGQAALNNGTATITPSLAAGTYQVVAAYAGNSNTGGSASTALSLVVNLAAATTTLTISPTSAIIDSPITFTATVAGNGVAPTGSVSFVSGTQTLGTATLNNGTAVFTTSTLAAGSYSVTAVYSGDANNGTSTSPTVNLTVNLIPTTTDLVATSTNGTPPQVLLVAVVIGNSGPTPTGTVTFTTGGTTIGSATLDSDGVATITPNLPNGTFQVVASYSGDSLHVPSQSQPVSVNGAPAGFSLTVTPNTLSMTASENSTVTVNITSVGGFADTVALGCASLPAGVTCTFANPSVTLAANATASTLLTIDTNSPLSGGPAAMNSGKSRGLSLAGLFLPFSVLFGFVFWRLRRRTASMLTVVLVAVLSLGALMATGCNGFGGSNVIPGSYTIEITGTGTQSDTIHYTTLTLTVTK